MFVRTIILLLGCLVSLFGTVPHALGQVDTTIVIVDAPLTASTTADQAMKAHTARLLLATSLKAKRAALEASLQRKKVVPHAEIQAKREQLRAELKAKKDAAAAKAEKNKKIAKQRKTRAALRARVPQNIKKSPATEPRLSTSSSTRSTISH